MAVTHASDIGARAHAVGGKAPVLSALIGMATVLMLAHAIGVLPPWLQRIPEAMIPPTADVLDAVFAFVQK